MNTEKIINRIKKEVGDEKILEKIGKLKRSDLHSLFLELFYDVSRKQNLTDLLKIARSSRFVSHSLLDQRELMAVDIFAYECLGKAFDAIELSPSAPFAINSTLSKVNQKNILSTTRNLELLADTTIMLAYFCANRRIAYLKQDKKSEKTVKIATTHRLIRQQNFKGQDGFIPHFRVFSVASAGKNIGSEKFEITNLFEHICFYLRLIKGLSQKKEYYAQNIKLYLSNIHIIEELVKQKIVNRSDIRKEIDHNWGKVANDLCSFFPNKVTSIKNVDLSNLPDYIIKQIELLVIMENKLVSVVCEEHPDVEIIFDLGRKAGIGYYSDICFKIVAENKDGEIFPLVDGGMSDWTQKIVASDKERLLVSGFGTELFCQQFVQK